MWNISHHLLHFPDVGKRSYDRPDCGLAVALDLLGERWTLLIVRELLFGPQRYTDLNTALDGLSTNLLAERLRHLEDVGIAARRDLPPPAACTVYELTEVGLELEPLVLRLAQWGARFAEDCSAITDPRSAAFAMLAQLEGASDTDTTECRLDIDGVSIAVQLRGGRLHAQPYAPADPAAVASTDSEAYLAILNGDLSWNDAVNRHAVRIEGDRAQFATLFASVRSR